MLDALNTAASGMQAQSKQVEIISNNIANADTTSFKKSRAEFQDLLYQTIQAPGAATSATTNNPTGVQVGVGVKLAATSREYQQGAMRPTGRALDVAIGGGGFFSIQQANGEIAYSRDGSFQLDSGGRLVTSHGNPVVPEIMVPPGASDLAITQDGRVTARVGNDTTELGQIQLTTFANPAGLLGEGGNLFSPSASSGTPVAANPGDAGVGTLNQNMLEASNVQPVTEMTDLIRAQRVYELNSKVIGSADQMMGTLNQLK